MSCIQWSLVYSVYYTKTIPEMKTCTSHSENFQVAPRASVVENSRVNCTIKIVYTHTAIVLSTIASNCRMWEVYNRISYYDGPVDEVSLRK